MGLEEFKKKTYLGDAVYASFDGYHIWLRTGDGNDQQIALEPQVFEALVQYRNKLNAALLMQKVERK